MVNSHEWLTTILNKLFEPEERRIDSRIRTLTEQNSFRKGRNLLGFMHLGQVYIPKENKLSLRAYKRNVGNGSTNPVPPLDFSLMQEASSFITDLRKIELDKAQIKQVLFKLIVNANDVQELRDSLPECLVALIPNQFRGLARKRIDPCFFIRSDHRAVREYERLLPKIEMYAMTRLLY